MTLRPLKSLVVLGLCLVGGGCSGLDRGRTPLAASTALRNPPSLLQQTHPDTERESVIRPAAFDEPVESNSEDSPHLLPVPPSNLSDDAAVQPRTITEALHPPVVSDAEDAEPMMMDLDLTAALAMAAGQNPRIAFAAARYREAYARLDAAQTLWLPSIRAGMSFNHHDGTLQASDGRVFDVSRSALQAGLGAQAVGAGSPAVPGVLAEFHTTDAIFQPKIAAFSVSARDAATQAATNDTLLATALAYLDMLRTAQQLSIAEETRDKVQQLAALTATFARTGQGPQADADRAQTELFRRRNDVSRAQEARRVAGARLAELLSLDPSAEILPQESTVVAIDLVPLPADATLNDLVATGLANRPELAEAQYLVCEAVHRYRREKFAPLVPSVLLGLSQSGFGGGFGSSVDNYRGRFDLDAAVYWELRNFGFAERARRDETTAQYDQALAAQAASMDRVAREVVEAGTQVKFRKSQIAVAASGIRTATDSYDRNTARIRNGQGLPIEVLQAISALDESRREYLRTVVEYNEAQFRLQRALGWPIH